MGTGLRDGVDAHRRRVFEDDPLTRYDPASGNHRMATSQQRVEFRTSLLL
jgi:hypothetical protein